MNDATEQKTFSQILKKKYVLMEVSLDYFNEKATVWGNLTVR